MDFVAWCDTVIKRLVNASDRTPELELYGFMDTQIAQAVFGDELTFSPEFSDSPAWNAMTQAVEELALVHLLTTGEIRGSPKVTEEARRFVADRLVLWRAICSQPLDRPAERELLGAINRLSPQDGPEYSSLTDLGRDALLAELGWHDPNDLVRYGEVLTQRRLAHCREAGIGPNAEKLCAHARYRGLVWETRRGFVV
jgi:hypothetical protein